MTGASTELTPSAVGGHSGGRIMLGNTLTKASHCDYPRLSAGAVGRQNTLITTLRGTCGVGWTPLGFLERK
jgi:hypothetical protein